MRSGNGKLIRGIALMLSLLLICAFALADVEQDEDGGVWDWDNGTYTAPDGRVVPITQDDNGEFGGQVTQDGNGGLVIAGDEAEQFVRNEDGSIEVESGAIQITPTPGPVVDGDAVWARGMQQAARQNGDYTPTFYLMDEGNPVEVPVVYMGVFRSMISLNGENTLVDTTRLSWETSAPAEKQLAVVKAKTYARLFAKSTKKSLVMDKVYNGTVLRVVKTDKNWTLVDYNGIRGYIQTSVLSFYSNEPREYKSGYVATKSGHTYGNSTVHVRNEPKGSQREEYRVGTPITVFEDDGTWCRIEVQGHMCYIQRQFMVYEESVAASAEGGV